MPAVTIANDVCDRCDAHVDPSTTTSGLCRDCVAASIECVYCADLEPADQSEPAYPEGRVCDWCASGYYTDCYHCARFARSDCHITTRWDGEAVCPTCLQDRYSRCEGCSEWIQFGDDCEDCDDDADDCDDDDADDCDDCDDCDDADDYVSGAEYSGVVYDYSYKPVPEFHGIGLLYLGLELEINTPLGELDNAAHLATSQLGTLGYLKSDSSIKRGFEIVTHPMSHDWAAEHFPWPMLAKLRGTGCSPDGNGLHVYVSRAAFDGSLHIYRWLKFFHRNQRQVIRIARRESERWAAFSDRSRRNAKTLAKGEAWGERYSAINTNNTDTLELRIFASSLTEREVQAALDLAAASVEYTRALTTQDIIRRGGWQWPAFRAWVASRPQYLALAHEMAAHDDTDETQELPCAC
jgi:hypothetical protein